MWPPSCHSYVLWAGSSLFAMAWPNGIARVGHRQVVGDTAPLRVALDLVAQEVLRHIRASHQSEHVRALPGPSFPTLSAS